MKANKDIIIEFLKNKDNEAELIEHLKKQNNFYNNSPTKFNKLVDNEYIRLILNLIRNSTGKLKYHAIIILSKMTLNFDSKSFENMCKIAIINSSNKDGNIRYASRLLIKGIDDLLFLMPLAQEFGKIKNTDIFYESFRSMFYELYDKYNGEKDIKIKESLSKSLSFVLPRIHDIATFDKDKEEIEIIEKLASQGVKWKPIKPFL